MKVEVANLPEAEERMEVDDLFDQVEHEVAQEIDPYNKLNIKRATGSIKSAEVIKNLMDPEVQHLYDKTYKNSMFLIENYVGKSVDSKPLMSMKKRRSFKGVLKSSKSQFKKSKIFDIKQGDITFEDMLAINSMWNEYVRDLLGISTQHNNSKSVITESSKMGILQNLTKADFHGAMISIFEARNNALVGLEGIVVKETRQTLTII